MTPAALAALLPDTIRIGPHDVAIVLDIEPGAFGSFDGDTAAIAIHPNLPTATFVVDTFLHEVMHGLFWAQTIQTDDEEHIVSALATGWTQIYRDNPWLLGWIRKGVS